MRFLVIGDCHAEIPDLDGLNLEKFDAFLAVGDICGTPESLREAGIEARGSDKEWYEILGEQKAKQILNDSLEQGRKVLGFLDSIGLPVYIVPGNADWTGELTDWEELAENRYRDMVDDFDNIEDLNFRTAEFKGLSIIGYGPCPGPETDPEFSENLERLESLFERAEDDIVLLSHNVPFDTCLDEAENGEHYGSKVVRQLIEERTPVVSVAGHMHEAQGSQELEDVTCLNTGFHSYVDLEIEDGKVDFEFGS